MHSWPCMKTLVLPITAILGALLGCGHEELPGATQASTRSAAAPRLEPPCTQVGSTMAQPTASTMLTEGPITTGSDGGVVEPPPVPGPQGPLTLGLAPQLDLSGLDDARLAGIAQAIRRAELEHVKVAQARALSARVQRFASDAAQQHRALAAQEQTTLSKLKLSPISSPVSDQILGDWENDRSALKGTQPLDFDRTFIDHQIQLDTKALALLDAAIASISNASLRSQLLNERDTIAELQREAQRLQRMPAPTQ